MIDLVDITRGILNSVRCMKNGVGFMNLFLLGVIGREKQALHYGVA
jgi:hypothetical protein